MRRSIADPSWAIRTILASIPGGVCSTGESLLSPVAGLILVRDSSGNPVYNRSHMKIV